jgi:hypothetical protein
MESMILFTDHQQKIYTGNLNDLAAIIEFINMESINLIEEYTEKS